MLVVAPWQLLVVHDELGPFSGASVAVNTLNKSNNSRNHEEVCAVLDVHTDLLGLLLHLSDLGIGGVLNYCSSSWNHVHRLGNKLHFKKLIIFIIL